MFFATSGLIESEAHPDSNSGMNSKNELKMSFGI
jgi:hypothetical protein